jgi:diacyltrehalose acyltransferase
MPKYAQPGGLSSSPASPKALLSSTPSKPGWPATPRPPAADQLQFIIFADPSRGLLSLMRPGTHIPVFDLTATTPVESQYDTTIVIAEYDGWADPPDRPWNLLATANAVAASGVARWWCRSTACRAAHQPALHGQTGFADPADVPPENITVTTNSLGATVTTMLVPTEALPLTQPLRGVLPGPVVDRIDNTLRPRIDAAYTRNDQPGDSRPFLSGGQLVRPNATQGEIRTFTNASVKLPTAQEQRDNDIKPSVRQRVRDRIAEHTNQRGRT